MRESRPKYKSVSDVVDRINELRKQIEERQNELDELNSLPFQEKKSEPQGFEYKEAIMEIFTENPTMSFQIDDIMELIFNKYKFKPDRNTITLRVGYLADNAGKKIERVVGKRGFYHLSQVNETQKTSGLGSSPLGSSPMGS